ncbi:hypothetical protein JHK87_040365 [Glycine soja]|nr:hypothetical protein JHK87_040365 [Glycine soja]
MTNANCPQESLHSVSNGNLRFDTAQTLVSRFLQVSSFFEDEDESPVESYETKVQTWSSQHYRNKPVVVVTAPRLQKYSSFDDQSGEKPLLLPIRSFKSRLSEEDIDVQSLSMSMSSKRFSSYSNRKAEVEAVDADDVDGEVQSQKRSTSSKIFSSNSNKNTKVEGSRAENKKKESVQEEFHEASNMMFPSSKEESRPVKSQPSCESSKTDGDEGPDVDKKADEFIAKFREQIRLQRIESINRSTRSARNSSR